MGYRGHHIEVKRVGRFVWAAYVISRDDGLPYDPPCPEHGWDPPRADLGALLIDGIPWYESSRRDIDCTCPVQTGFDLRGDAYHGLSHKSAWCRARRHMDRD